MEDLEWLQMLEKMQDIRQFCSNHIKRSIKGGITSAQELDFLSRLELSEGEQTPQRLCAEMGICKSMVSRLVEHTEQKGFVKKVVSSHDKRSYSLEITPLGREELEHTYTHYLEPMYRLRRSLGQEDFQMLMALIRRSNQMESQEK